MSLSRLDANSHVFVTGATGLIGGEVVRYLLGETQARVTCLVRANSPEKARERVLERLMRSGERPCPEVLSRLDARGGDIVAPDLGLPPGERARLADSVDVLVHAAADTSFITQRRCRDTNILGTENLLALGQECRREISFVHVSTACNVGEVRHRCLPEDDGCRPENRHHNEYTRSKAIAEQRVRASGLDALIVRPSIVLSAGIPDEVFARQILWIAPLFNEFERLPIDPRARIDVVPVSFVARSILGLLELPRRRYDCYHLSAGLDFSQTMGDWIHAINQHYSSRPPLQLNTDGAWTREHELRYLSSPRQRRLYASVRHYLPFLNMDLVFDNSRLRSELDVCELGLTAPTSYFPEVLGLISFAQALEESANP